jgi:hypothetical protein
MSLDKAVKHGKEKRKQYSGSKHFSASCRNHGGCPYCEGNRLHKYKRREPIPDDYTVPTKQDTIRLFCACLPENFPNLNASQPTF